MKPLICAQLIAVACAALSLAGTGNAVTSTASRRDASFAFADLNKIFKDNPRTKVSERKVGEAKASAQAEYGQRVARGGAKSGLNHWRTAREKELRDRADSLRDDLVTEITDRVKRLAEGVNLVWDSSGNSLNGIPVALVTPSQANITAAVSSALAGITASPATGARGLKLGLVDMNRIFKEFNKTVAAEAKINGLKEEAKQDYNRRATSYKMLSEAISTMGPGRERQRETVELKAQEKEINEFRVTKEKELQEIALKMRQDIITEITEAIRSKVAGEPLPLILDKSGISWNGAPVVLWSSGVSDLSNSVIAGLNSGAAATKDSARDNSLTSSSALRIGCVDMEGVFRALPEAQQSEKEIQQLKQTAAVAAHDPTVKAKPNMAQEITARRASIVAKISAQIRQIADKDGYNLILDSSGLSQNGVPVIIATSDMPDITDEVRRALSSARH